ncbi:MAG: dTDP-4-dehydrorhamnose 3,5-epimerase [Ectothiorhodospiraceae bacterium]|nr:dTDP-4-dehydrorhamnose 3,5-epimerase [Ectothiorhodospiraceae bacterium]
MRVTRTDLAEVLLIEPTVHRDGRGFFVESYHAARYAEHLGADVRFVQDNHSRSGAGVLRGLHYQLARPQGKLVRVTFGRIFDVAVDLRRGSPAFGRWTAVELSADDHRQLWIPPGFAHGFLVLGDAAEVQYKTTDYWVADDERCVRFDDPTIGIPWPLTGEPVLSARDRAAPLLGAADTYP